jgi:hypothetical protein
VSLQWHTAGEQVNYGFWVQRKQSAGYQDRGFIPGAGTAVASTSYRYVDTLSCPGDFCYRLKQVDLDGSITYSPEIMVQLALPTAFSLHPVHPNPFNASAVIQFDLGRACFVLLDVVNVQGERVRLLCSRVTAAGQHQMVWDGRDDRGAHVSSGTFFVRMQSEGVQYIQKCAYIR